VPRQRAEREVSAGGIVFRRIEGKPTHFLLIRDSYRHWGFPKGHLEDGETPAQAADRETREETGLEHLNLHGPIKLIDWFFRFRGRRIHKFCHFFLFESPDGDPVPQLSEGISDYRWLPLDRALKQLSYDNARGVLKRAGEMTRTLVAAGEGRPKRRSPHPEDHQQNGQDDAPVAPEQEPPQPVDEVVALADRPSTPPA
jgi:8-oxo-dGTP pyrophosphatase MutT (NUDIX family)